VTGSGGLGKFVTGAIKLFVPTVMGRAKRSFSAQGTLTLPKVTASGVASGIEKDTENASGGITVPLMSVTGSVLKKYSGTGAVALHMLTVSGSGGPGKFVAGSVKLKVIEVQGRAQKVFPGSGAVTLPLVTVSGSAKWKITTAGNASLFVPSVSGTGTRTRKISGAVQLPKVSVSSTVNRLWNVAGGVVLPKVQASSTGIISKQGSGSVALPLPSVSGSTEFVLTASGGVTVPLLTVAGSVIFVDENVLSGNISIPLLTIIGKGQIQLEEGTYPPVDDDEHEDPDEEGDSVGFLKRMRKQWAIYWPPPQPDGCGGYTFTDPLAVKVRWENMAEEFTDSGGQRQFSKSIVFAGIDFGVGGWLMLGNLADLDSTYLHNPQSAVNAFPIQQFEKIPNLRNTKVVRRAHL
jgi:hypothetical protein